ncbi:MAG: RluA family pseudouridine synthase [Acidimicrobiia bacterium]
MAEKYSFEVPQSIDGVRIDKVLAIETELSRSLLSQMFKDGLVKLNGKNVKQSEKVKFGDLVEAEISPNTDEVIEPQNIEFETIYEDEHLLVINKSSGLVVHPGAGNKDNTLVNGLVYRYPEIVNVGESHRPGIVHRLDAGTSGLLVVAKSQEVYEKFVQMFSIHDVKRNYFALAWGKFATSSGVIDASIGRSQTRATRMAVKENGKNARTHYAVKNYYPDFDVTLLDVSLETGRTHQIRVHCAAINHPVVGDKTYGGFRQTIETDRIFLHAYELIFVHPVLNKEMKFKSLLPEDLQEILDRIS